MPFVFLTMIAYWFREEVDPTIFVGCGVLFFLVDSFLFYSGRDTVLWKHTTANEKEFQRRKLGLDP